MSEAGDEGQMPDDFDSNLIRALNHRVRRDILRALHASEDPLSPARLAETTGEPLSKVSYHVRILATLKTIVLDSERQVRGSIEHLYVSAVADDEQVVALLEATLKSDEAD